MNKKGFTLVEILATLVILSFIFMLTYPTIQKAFNNGKTAISELSKKQIEDAAKIVIDEVIYCNMSEDTKSLLNATNCKDALDKIVNGINVDISKLNLDNINNKQKCEGIISIKIDRETYKETIDTTNVICK